MGMSEMLALQLQLIQDISGVHGAIQGIAPQSGTPSSRFAQEAQNALLNTLDYMNTFNSFLARRNYKMLKIITQYYKEERYLSINGRTLSEDSRLYRPSMVKGIDFDIVISEGKNTPVYKQIIDDTLFQMLNAQFIDVEMYLEHVSLPFADALLADIRQKKEKLAQGEVGQLDPSMMQQVQQNADPRAIELAQKAMGLNQMA